MFDIGFSELLVVAVVALLVLGPERLPRAARFTGLWVRRARAQWYSVKSELENELADDELRRSLRRTQDELREARDRLRASGDLVQREFAQLDPAATPAPGPREPGPTPQPQRDPDPHPGEPARRDPDRDPPVGEPDPRTPDDPDSPGQPLRHPAAGDDAADRRA